jgi:hypothetical protein
MHSLSLHAHFLPIFMEDRVVLVPLFFFSSLPPSEASSRVVTVTLPIHSSAWQMGLDAIDMEDLVVILLAVSFLALSFIVYSP